MLRALFEALLYLFVEGTWHGITHAGQKGSADPHSAGLKDWRDDPVYKKNLQRLIERNRQFEEAKNEPRS